MHGRNIDHSKPLLSLFFEKSVQTSDQSKICPKCQNQNLERMNEGIDANTDGTVKVKFDHVAMDNFHAVLVRMSEK